ncbi:MAG: geranylgeranylglycerol-phosphate geranylgeranyltransferase [Saprospiraceae bacterium]|nr:geranylgeranylglycerol-phosphate geranylgeranyltransferase [Saprospiraceae bacterium]
MIHAIFKLSRWPNVIIVALVQLTFYYRHLVPTLEANQLERAFDDLHVGLFVLCSMLITAAGNVINDIFDVQTDEINKPEKMIINRLISEKWAMITYVIQIGLGAAIAVYLAAHIDRLEWFWIYFVAVALLWVYSKWLKGVVFIGNLTISLLCVGVFLVIILLEYNALQTLSQINPEAYHRFILIVSGFSVLALMITWTREIAKDAEDHDGDLETGWRTIPTTFGLKTTATILRILMTVFVGLLLYWLIVYFSRPIDWILVVPGLILPLCLMIVVLRNYDEQVIYKKISLHLKLMMLLAIIYLYLI